MSGFIVDASVAIKWVVAEPDADLALPLLDQPLAAPDLLGAECANILWKKVMRGEISAQEAEAMVAALARADISLPHAPVSAGGSRHGQRPAPPGL